MRPLELVLTLTLIPPLLVPLVSGRLRRWAVLSALLPTVALLVQIALEGWRWQIVPLYAAALLVLLVRLPDLLRPRNVIRRRWMGSVGSVLLLVMIGVGAGLAALLPVFSLPAPTGPYTVGTSARHLQNGTQELMAQVWYPAATSEGTVRAPYIPDIDQMAPALAGVLGLPGWVFDYVRYVPTSAYLDAPAAEGVFPVLILSHGLGSYRHGSVALAQELASQGYVVISLDHPRISAVLSVYPDGRTVAFESDADNFTDEGVQVWRRGYEANIVFALDQLPALNAADPLLAGHLDPESIGLLGHSAGGIGSVFVCLSDARCDASINMDGGLFGGNTLPGTPTRPHLELLSSTRMNLLIPSQAELDQAEMTREEFQQQIDQYYTDMVALAERLGDAVPQVMIWDSGHNSFTDTPYLLPAAPAAMGGGTLPQVEVQRLINATVLAFLNTHVRGNPDSRPLDDPNVRLLTLDDWQAALAQP